MANWVCLHYLCTNLECLCKGHFIDFTVKIIRISHQKKCPQSGDRMAALCIASSSVATLASTSASQGQQSPGKARPGTVRITILRGKSKVQVFSNGSWQACYYISLN